MSGQKNQNAKQNQKNNSKNSYKVQNSMDSKPEYRKINEAERCASPTGPKGPRPQNKK